MSAESICTWLQFLRSAVFHQCSWWTTANTKPLPLRRPLRFLAANIEVGDVLRGVLIVPATSAAGVVTILDGATSISIFAGGGTTALSDLKPLWVPLGLVSVNGPWKITTGANVSAVGVGKFSA